MFSNEEKKEFEPFYKFCTSNSRKELKLIYSDKELIVEFDTAYETENIEDQETRNAAEEDYYAILFRIIKVISNKSNEKILTDSLFEVTYKNVPTKYAVFQN